ncbi:50S ribosomal protein L5 [Patescibacteria group bacterium]|nr:50S ribosomal protein L5 [Patescibacteria group bacterium]MBU1075340.1 50S ribosomal protein L5 [Patescibacteria group bacterium]MBU1951408.1 50S ribosomal protein L5 [Patescibacteria group bacterium]MBU2229264.1 50S ribosomal protein L5 [Patescibacteria group bacterium]MBU2235640.1 50S ribosomal protein L5 [Patescibacteria group bacterium]
MTSLKEKYKKEVAPALMEKMGYKNAMAIPHIEKVTLNVGVGRAIQDAKFLDIVKNTLERITGQKPVLTKSKKSISNFKIRAGMTVGIKVTLRGDRMYDFLTKLINISLPRVRDFRGISQNSVNEQGNLCIGFVEHTVFPEIHPDEVEVVHGLEVNISTTTKTKEEGIALFTLLGFPFQEE